MQHRQTRSPASTRSSTENVPLAPYTWYKIGGPARWFVRPRSVEELQEAARRCVENDIPIYVLGLGANLLVSDEGVDGAVFRLDEELLAAREVRQERPSKSAPASTCRSCSSAPSARAWPASSASPASPARSAAASA